MPLAARSESADEAQHLRVLRGWVHHRALPHPSIGLVGTHTA